ncbi:hypothetical protein Ahy_B10g105550 [Arachis hypogaea]|uniref:Aminotransferase-like plant mobile domain-containing protein n=1 Tax=Arachis hypogaea TaxID=3818 RepID=A0A444X8B9_ARAHY|nr:hypothetical protein Ahy_B10g105550 [Arachis hypogaea]
MQETFGEIPDGADDATIQRYARAYIMMLLGTQLFEDKSGTRLHIRWLPYVARLEDMGGTVGDQLLCHGYTAGYDIVRWPLASRWSGYNPTASERGPRAAHWRLRIDLLQAGDVVHPEILEPRHMALWRSVTSLIYLAVIEWHQVDQVLPQFGGVQPLPRSALNIDFLMAKDGRGGDRWFPYTLQFWHLHWDSRVDHVLRFDVVPNPGPAVPIPAEALQRGPGRVPDMDRVDDVPDRRRVEQRARVGTRRNGCEWQWLDQAMEAGEGRGRVHARRGRGGQCRPAGRGRGGQDDDDGGDHGGGDGRGDAGGMPGAGENTGEGPSGGAGGAFGDYFVGVPNDDHPVHESQTWVSPGRLLSDKLTSDGLDAEFGSSHFLEEISVIMQEDEAAR